MDFQKRFAAYKLPGAEMVESLRIFGLLLHKSWLVRKRHYLATLFGEILLPVGLVALIWLSTIASNKPPKQVKTDSHYRMQSSDELIDGITHSGYGSVRIFYAPNNNFTKKLMMNVYECFKRKAYIVGFPTESEFLVFYYGNEFFEGTAVIFDESVDQSVKHLRYKIRDKSSAVPLYNREAWNVTEHYTSTYPFAQVQICLDRSFVKVKRARNSKDVPDIYIQQVPYPPHIKLIPFNDEIRKVLQVILMVSFTFPLFIETSRAADEKFVGVNVLMSMNGISNTLNLLSWVTSGFLLLSVFCGIPILLLLTHSLGYGLPFMYYGNPLLLFFILLFYIAHLLTFGIHISAYFSKALLVSIALTISNILTIQLRVYVFTESTLYLVPYVGIIFPNLLFFQAMEEIRSYENMGEGIQWYNLFVNANTASKVGGSIGMVLILSAIGVILNFLLAIYVLAINPGKYGVAKDPLYFLKSKSKEDNDDWTKSLKYDETNDPYFESIPSGVYVPGIQIRNLKKAFNIGLFSKQKVHALRGVSVDFYKGQITSLLGHNGAGKTTMMSILTGMTSPTEGKVLFNSKDLKENVSEIVNDMGLCRQENIYFSSLTVSEQLLFFAMLKGKDKSKSSVRENVKTLLQKLNLVDKKDALPKTLSGGQKRRLCLGMALVGDSSTLILDEPTSGLDPESRRVIWNILLKMRGQKTILISTHDMEEADILGDRIAIMHTGQLKSYGTSLFLKRLIGQNNVEVILSIGPESDPERIRNELHEDGVITSREANKLTISIPNSPKLPDSLDNLEEKKEDFGVSGFSVSLITLEQVFLKVTQENDDPPKPHQILNSKEAKLTGSALYTQTVRALLLKKLTYALKDYITMLIKIFTIFMALLMNAIILEDVNDSTPFEKESIPLNLGMYTKPQVFYTSYERSFGDRYKTVSRNLGGNPIEVTGSNLESSLLQRARDNLVLYDNYLIAAAEFNKTTFNAFYSEAATFSLPISINLLWNTIVKNLVGIEYSISLFRQELPQRFVFHLDMTILGGITAFAFMLELCSTIAMFVVHPIRESSRGVKQLQKMSGVSGFTYWGTMFLFDLIEYAFLVILVTIGLVCVDLSLGLRLYGPTEISLEILLLLLFGINTLPLMYTFSFIKKKTRTVVDLATNISMGIMVIDLMMYFTKLAVRDSDVMNNFRGIQKGIFMLVPHVSFLHGQISFFVTAQTNARCHRLPNNFYDLWCKKLLTTDVCCGFNCYDGKCEKSKQFFTDSDEDISLTASVIYLCVTPILYFGILAVVESQYIHKSIVKHAKHVDTVEPNVDEQVQREKSMIFQQIQVLSRIEPSSVSSEEISNGPTLRAENLPNSMQNRLFLVYELRKSYKRVKAVKDVSFGVNRRECFGLLGVNGAGKSTTFRMMTGGEVPDHGTMYIGDKDFENNERYFLSQMGYCPQHDAILNCLNSYDHLRLFARLRGIPEGQVEDEVQAWIKRLNLNACASQPSDTYSGGNKRRLNIAIALIGDPNLILMDEPTTGVDPGARRSLWNVIKACQMAGQAVVLTSHSMVECEALCNRLAIMVDGKLVCIGASEELKQRFGAGYDIHIKMDPEKARDQVDGIKNDLPQSLNCILTDENLGYLLYHVAPEGTTWRKMYDAMNETKSNYDCIEDFSVLSSSLEQLFLLFARAANSNLSS